MQTLKKSKTKKSKNSIIVHQICCHAFLEEQAWCSMGSSSFLFQHVYPILRECAAEQRTSSWLRARVAKGLRAAPLRQFRRAKQSKLYQIMARRTSSRIKPDHHMLCRNFACGLPKISLLLRISHAPRKENGPHGYERLGAPSGKEVGEHARKKKKASTDGGQLFTKVALRSNVFHRPLFATEPPLRLRSRPPDSGFAGYCRGIAGT